MKDTALYDVTLLEPIAEARAIRELVTIADPAAGGGLTRTIEGGYVVRPLALHFRIVTSAAVANRTVYVEYRDTGGVPFLTMGAPVTIPASSTYDLSFWRLLGQPDWPIVTRIVAPLASVLLDPTQQLVITVDSVQAGDQLSRIRLLQERFPTG